MSARKPKPAPMPYFDNLPPAALPALQAAWDKVMEKFSMTAVFEGFSRDMNELKYVAPTRPECNDWVNAVRNGLVERPTAAAMRAASEAFTPLTPETFPSAAQPDGGAMSDFVPGLPPAAVIEFLGEKEAEADVVGKLRTVRDEAPETDITVALRSLRDQLIDIVYASLRADLRRRAEKIVAGQLRAMADEMEGGAA